MKNLETESFKKLAKSKYPEEEIEPYNPWAICNTSTRGKKEEPEKFERCVKKSKNKNREENKDTGETKDVRGRTSNYRSNVTPEEEFKKKMDNEKSGRAQEEEGRRLDDVWLDSLRKEKLKKERQPAYAFVIEAKKKSKS